MKSWKNLAIASILAAAFFGVVAACGSDDSDGGSGNSGSGAGSGAGGGTGGSSASGGGGGSAASGTGGSFFDSGNLGDGPTADSFDPDATCAESEYTATLKPANMLFLIDRTGSMNCNPPPTQTTAECEASPVPKNPAEPSKWAITRDSLIAAWNGLQGTDPLPSIGVMLFNNNDQCGFPTVPDVDVQALSGPQLNALILNLQAVTPKGSTPIIGATMSAYSFLSANGASFVGNKFVVLLTDGAETCDSTPGIKDFLVGKAADANSVGIRTFVLGAPGSEPERAFLSQIAFAGGTASSPTCDHSGSAADVGDCHMDMTLPGMNFATELQNNLEAISGEALSCEFDVPQPGPGEPPIDYNKVNVIYTDGDGNEETLPQDTTVDCSDPTNKGWQYSDDKTKIYLCGEACENVKADNQASIAIQLGCVTQVVPK